MLLTFDAQPLASTDVFWNPKNLPVVFVSKPAWKQHRKMIKVSLTHVRIHSTTSFKYLPNVTFSGTKTDDLVVSPRNHLYLQEGEAQGQEHQVKEAIVTWMSDLGTSRKGCALVMRGPRASYQERIDCSNT